MLPTLIASTTGAVRGGRNPALIITASAGGIAGGHIVLPFTAI